MTEQNLGQVSAIWEHPTIEPPTKNVIWAKGSTSMGFLHYRWDGTSWVLCYDPSLTLGLLGTYTNANPVPNTLGGVNAGETFDQVPILDMITKMLYPFMPPNFSSFSMQGQPTKLEVGQTITGGNRFFNWSVNNTESLQLNSIQIQDITTNQLLITGTNNDNTETLNIGTDITKNTATNHAWRISAMDSNSNPFSRSFTVNWMYRVYFGENVTPTADESLIKNLRVNELSEDITKQMNFIGGGYKYFAFPSYLGTISNFIDPATTFNVPMESPYTVPVTNVLGVTTDYIVYRTTNLMNGSISIITS